MASNYTQYTPLYDFNLARRLSFTASSSMRRVLKLSTVSFNRFSRRFEFFKSLRAFRKRSMTAPSAISVDVEAITGTWP